MRSEAEIILRLVAITLGIAGTAIITVVVSVCLDRRPPETVIDWLCVIILGCLVGVVIF